MRVKSLDMIDADRLRLIPKDCHAAHEFCFSIHDLMVHLLASGEAKNINTVKFKFNSKEEAHEFAASDDPLDFLLKAGRDDTHKKIVLNQVTTALFADFLHFMHESLISLEKRKFTVAMALLRKPLRENLMFASWLKADSTDFYKRLKESPADLMETKYLTAERRKGFLSSSISSSKGMGFADADKIYNIIYDKKNKNGFAALFDKANHLVTSHQGMRTEELNLNFIFKNPNDNDFYESIYGDIAYIMMYANSLMISLHSDMSQVDTEYLDYTLLTSMGSYTSLFIRGENPVSRGINNLLKEYLRCPHCGNSVKVRKNNAPRFFMSQILDCTKCGLDHQFPLHWLLSQGKLKVEDD